MAYPSGLSISSCDNNLVDERQAAAILDLRVATLRRWRYSGDGPEYIKLGAAVMAAIEVLSIRAITGAGNLRGIATVRLGSLVIHGWRVIQQAGQKAHVSVPQQQSHDGRWFPLLEVRNPGLLGEVRRVVLEARGQREC